MWKPCSPTSYENITSSLPEQHIHLAEDRIFYHRDKSIATENPLNSLTFQREVINHTIPQVNPDLIHCNDWMTGLIPAMANRHGIPSPLHRPQYPQRECQSQPDGRSRD
ncbi:MAG: glycogen/starch synthase [Luteolibacter sp.]